MGSTLVVAVISSIHYYVVVLLSHDTYSVGTVVISISVANYEVVLLFIIQISGTSYT